MESQTSQQAVLDSQKLQQLQDEIQQEIIEIINKSNLEKLLEKHGVSGKDIVTIQINLDKVQEINAAEKQETQNSVIQIPQKLTLKSCIITSQGMVCSWP